MGRAEGLGVGGAFTGTGDWRGTCCLWVPNSHSLTPFPFQAPKASDRDLGPASSEWQRKLEAAEALLTLRYSSQAPSGSTSLLQPCAAPGSLVLERRTRSGNSWEIGGHCDKQDLTGKSGLVG